MPEEKAQEEAANSVSNHIRIIEDLISKSYANMSSFKDEETRLRDEIDTVLNNLMEKNDGVQDALHPEVVGGYQALKNASRIQKEENEQMYKELLSLKKETTTLN